MRFTHILSVSILFLGLLACGERKIDFNAEIRPILNESCVSCHGGVKQAGGFGLVFREDALGLTESEKYGIVPGDPEASEMYRRIVHHDPEERMPYEEPPLGETEIALIKQWIEQGAEWNEHWAYIPPVLPDPPAIRSDWIRTPIDAFVLEQMQAHALQPAPPATPEDLLRRLYLDLTGLPPTEAQVTQFIREDNYEQIVDQLLASPQFGENWASLWLDLARYADSFGYSSDLDRNIWRYRDWVIRALNDDMPFDQFTIEQLAGDLLPDPSMEQLVATAFHRNTMTNGEGGANHEEFRTAAVMDRVTTTWEVWQGTTMGCVQCHSHPYDPIRHEEFYQSLALFNQTTDRNLIAEYPLLKTLEPADSLALDKIKQWVRQQGDESEALAWERRILIAEPRLTAEDFADTVHVQHYNRVGDDFMSVFSGSWIKLTDLSLAETAQLALNYRQWMKGEGELFVHLDQQDGPVIGQIRLPQSPAFQMLLIPLKTSASQGDLWIEVRSQQADFRGFVDGFLPLPPLQGQDQAGYAEIAESLPDLLNAKPRYTTPVMVARAPDRERTTHIFERGNWLTPGDEVQPGVPGVFQAQAVTNRLELAQWLVSEENPLTSRVMVNRVWARLLGRGLVESAEDFGSLGDLPSHPALLDWLAVNFSGQGDWAWRFKPMIKSIVLSATYQQSAKVSLASLEKDPDNLWLSHSPRVRLTAEQIRDQVLQVSGLLSLKMYGPSVMPQQPDGIWKVAFSNARWEESTGEDRYRRAIYTYLKRSAPYPSLVTFDATDRQVCLSRRIPTNTPLQALVTLNDPVFFEAAQQLAQKLLTEKETTPERLRLAYTTVMAKAPAPEKEKVMETLFSETYEYLAAHPDEAQEIAQTDHLDLAVLTVVANALMNMDEFIVKS